MVLAVLMIRLVIVIKWWMKANYHPSTEMGFHFPVGPRQVAEEVLLFLLTYTIFK